jgi:ABC-type transport system involved in multi-copper enzyme maturation permease subunit
MVRKMFWREWKEKLDLLIFALAGIALYLVAFAYFSQKKDLLDILTGAVTLIFLPFIGLLLGSSGFAAEFKGDAWAYLFSRPVKKSTIWLTKYFALLTVLAAVLIFFAIAARIMPGLGATIAEFDLRNLDIGLNQSVSFMSLGFMLAWILLTISFSLSSLSEKQYAVIFLTCLIWAALEFGLFQFLLFVLTPMIGYRARFIGLVSFPLLIPLSFALASFLSFGRTDFSQPRRKIRNFVKLELPFLAAALVLGSFWTAASAVRERAPRISNLQVQGAKVYFATPKKIFSFDPERNRLQALVRVRQPWMNMSIGGHKLAFVKYSLDFKYRESNELWVMNTDGTGVESLRVTSREGSPFSDASFLFPVEVSPDGGRVAFATKDNDKRPVQWLLGCVNTDGTGLKSYSLDMPDVYWVRFVGWTPDLQDLLILVSPDVRAPDRGSRLVRFNLNTGATEIVAEHIMRPTGGQLSRDRLIAFISRDDIEAKQVLTLLDIENREKREIYRASSIDGSKWSEDGSRLAFLAEKHTLGIYSLAEKKITAVREFSGVDFNFPGLSIDWILGGDGLALGEFREEKGYLDVLNPDLSLKKTIPFPFTADQESMLLGIDESVIVRQGGKAQLWLVDLNTERWRKIY